MNSLAIHLQGLKYSYPGHAPILAIDDFKVERKSKIFLHGPSGSGKTTLLSLLTALTVPNEGTVEVLGQNLSRLNGSGRDRFRGSHVGYIFQMFNLIPYLSVQDNITLPCFMNAERAKRLQGKSPTEEAHRIAEGLGIRELMTRSVSNLSVGQQQRVAAARALIGSPEIIIADEPTSALDVDHRERFLKLLFDQVHAAGSTLLFVSHDHTLKAQFDQVVSLASINRASPIKEQP